MKNYIVSVRLMTYNHEKFIKEAMDGIMMQETTFPVEVVVGDDFSTDNTLEIIRSYSNSENIHIRILDRPRGGEYDIKRQEKGRLYNFQNIIENCRGKYIALLDGDDYWTDSLKLQKQVDFLEKNENYSITAHLTNVFSNNRLISKSSSSVDYELKDLIKEIRIGGATCSILFRNTQQIRDKILTDVFIKSGAGDWLISISALTFGKMRFHNKPMAVYRVHTGGIYSSKSWLEQFQIYLLTALAVDELTDRKYHSQIINYNIRKLFLKVASGFNLMTLEEFWMLYVSIERKKWREIITRICINSPLKAIYLKYISKLFFYKIHVK